MFKAFSEPVQLRFMELSEGELFVVQADDIFERYLAAFPPGTNEVYRQRREYECKCCEAFVRRLGVVVGIKDSKMITLWGGHNLPEPYKTVSDALHEYISSRRIRSVFRTTEKKYGAAFTFEKENNRKWEHFVGEVDRKHSSRDADTERAKKDSAFQVCRRGLQEFREEDFESVLDLIAANSLYKGAEFKAAIVGFQKLMKGYRESGNSELFVWENVSNPFAGFRNTAIGTLFVDLAKGDELDAAVNAYEAKVSANTYKRTTSVITQKMVEGAVAKLHELGLSGMTNRRYARISDITVENVLFVDHETRSKMKDGIVELLEGSVAKSTPDLKGAVPISAEEFLAKVLPGSKSVEVLVQNKHAGNFVSLTGADGPERPFKWSNNFAWSYDGEVTDSVKQRVKEAGGNIHADLRVSLSWFNFDDLDLHAELSPYGHIYFRYPYIHGTSVKILDVDKNAFTPVKTPVENLAFMKPRDGSYRFSVNQFRRRETTDFGFGFDVEHEGIVRKFSYDKSMRDGETIRCLDLEMKGGKIVAWKSYLTEGTSSQDKWGIKTETLVPVTIIAFSPNYWGENAVGAKHTIFGLKGCKNPEPTRGIYNEYLRSDLNEHRKVFEVLASKTKCKPTDDQISGLGFTAARGDTVTVVVDGRRSYVLTF